MPFALALLLQASAAPVTAPPPANRDGIVTGERLKSLHDKCKKGGCTVLRDAQASIALAEAQFRDGRYLDAKWTLRDATRRNARFASSDPKPVAALYEAYATVSWQEGDQDVFKRATADRVRTLRDHLPPDDINVRAAALALGDMWIRLKKTASSRPAGIAIADGLRLGLASVAAKRGSP